MASLLDRITGRREQRIGNALDRLAQAARDAAAGKAVDDTDVEAALHEIGKPVSYFGELVEVANRRRVAAAALERLGTATTKQRRLEDSIASEQKRYEEYRAAYLARVGALEADKREVDGMIERANAGRVALLDPANVLGGLAERYREVLAERDAAGTLVSEAARDAKQQRDRIAEADRWIVSIRRKYETEIKPAVGMMRPESSALARELEPHETTKRRAQRRLDDELLPRLREAEERLDRATRAVVAAELECLKA
jgi:hypothetical protein